MLDGQRLKSQNLLEFKPQAYQTKKTQFFHLCRFQMSLKSHSIRIIVATTVAMLSACATKQQEKNIDWFARTVNDPSVTQYAYCVSATTETTDGVAPLSGIYMTNWCSNDFEATKKRVVANCENIKKVKCMPVFYFERGKGVRIKTFEEENISRKQEEARIESIELDRQERRRLERVCSEFGLRKDSPALRQCIDQRMASPLTVEPSSRWQKLTMIEVINACRDHHKFNEFYGLMTCVRVSYDNFGTTPNSTDVQNFYTLMLAIEEDYQRKKITMTKANAELIKAWQMTIEASNNASKARSSNSDPAEAFNRHQRFQNCLNRGGSMCLP